VDGGEAERRVAPGGAEADGLVVVALGRQAAIAGPAIGGHRRGLGDLGGEEALEARGRGIGQHGQPEPAEAAAAGFAASGLDGTGDQRLAGRTAAALARFRAADMGLVSLDPLRQRLAVGSNHRPADLVQPSPGRLVAAEAHLPLQLGGGDPTLARGHQVDGEKPLGEAGLGLLEDGAGEQGMLLAAGHAFVDDLGPERVGVGVVAAGAAETVRPACVEQIVTALRIGAESTDEARQIFW
jgi:hypothetical protein